MSQKHYFYFLAPSSRLLKNYTNNQKLPLIFISDSLNNSFYLIFLNQVLFFSFLHLLSFLIHLIKQNMFGFDHFISLIFQSLFLDNVFMSSCLKHHLVHFSFLSNFHYFPNLFLMLLCCSFFVHIGMFYSVNQLLNIFAFFTYS